MSWDNFTGIPDRQIAEMRRRWPELDISKVTATCILYLSECGHPQTPPEAIRKACDRIFETATDLRIALLEAPDEVLDHLAITGARSGDGGLVSQLLPNLAALRSAAQAKYIDEAGVDGRELPRSRTKLIRSLKAKLESVGIDVTKKPGELPRLYQIVLEAMGETSGDPRKAVRDALKQ